MMVQKFILSLLKSKLSKLDRSKLSMFILIENFGAEIGHLISVPAKKPVGEQKWLTKEYGSFENLCPCIPGFSVKSLKPIPKGSRSLDFIKLVLNSMLVYIEAMKCYGSVMANSFTYGFVI